jgi:5-methylcytosine-specific restriction protein A
MRIFDRDGWTCAKCGRLVTEAEAELDHIKPLSRGGTHDDANLATLCIACHRTKTRRERQKG